MDNMGVRDHCPFPFCYYVIGSNVYFWFSEDNIKEVPQQADYLLWMSYVLQRPIERDFIAGVGVKSVHFVQRIFLLFLVR